MEHIFVIISYFIILIAGVLGGGDSSCLSVDLKFSKLSSKIQEDFKKFIQNGQIYAAELLVTLVKIEIIRILGNFDPILSKSDEKILKNLNKKADFAAFCIIQNISK
ncbi:hypothetical protein ACKWTF_014274 [Chironomus riparius]